jgi:sugar lactone lactonase YvrE
MQDPIVELFADQSLSCGEGPVWDPDSGSIYWTDSGGEAIYRSAENSPGFELYAEGIHAASLTLHFAGGLMICGKNGFYQLTDNGDLRMVSDACGNIPPKNVNDIIADPAGRIFGGQEMFRESEAYNPGYLFRVSQGGETSIVDEGLHLSNGMGFSPALDKFYLVDTIPGNIYVYDYHLQTGDITNKKILVHLNRNEGLPDGMTVDADGFIWVARWFGNGLSRYDPDGKIERKINLPASQTSSVTFGGKDYNEIFITTAAGLWETPLAPDNHQFSSHRGGGVYRIVQDILGKPEYKANV